MKKNIDIIRAWKDSSYRNSLSAADQAALPANPAGELSSDDLTQVSGGEAQRTHRVFSLGCPCPSKITTQGTLCCPY